MYMFMTHFHPFCVHHVYNLSCFRFTCSCVENWPLHLIVLLGLYHEVKRYKFWLNKTKSRLHNPGINNSVFVADVKKLAVPSLKTYYINHIYVHYLQWYLPYAKSTDYPWAIGQKSKALCYWISWDPVEPYNYSNSPT